MTVLTNVPTAELVAELARRNLPTDGSEVDRLLSGLSVEEILGHADAGVVTADQARRYLQRTGALRA